MDGSICGARSARTAGVLVALYLMLTAAGGCSTTVRPPSQPLQPVTIYLTDEFIHSSVVMPMGDGRYVEYAFGDWTYAALNRHDPFHTFSRAVLLAAGRAGPTLSSSRYEHEGSGAGVEKASP